MYISITINFIEKYIISDIFDSFSAKECTQNLSDARKFIFPIYLNNFD